MPSNNKNFEEAAQELFGDWVKTGRSLGSWRAFGFGKRGTSIILLVILALVTINVVIGTLLILGR